MSNEGFKGIPGLPDGWELVEFRRGQIGEYVIDGDGKPHSLTSATCGYFAIIREIEVPKQYRPFANGAEFKPHRDRWVTRVDKSDIAACPGACRFFAYDDQGILWERLSQTWRDAFDAGRCFDDDGTPFGVEVTSE
jgi:hypothetical protein